MGRRRTYCSTQTTGSTLAIRSRQFRRPRTTNLGSTLRGACSRRSPSSIQCTTCGWSLSLLEAKRFWTLRSCRLMPHSLTLTHQACPRLSHAQLDMQATSNSPLSTKCSTTTGNYRSPNLAMKQKTRSMEKSTSRTTTSQGLGQPTLRTLRGYTQAHTRKAGYLKLVVPADMYSSTTRPSKWT